MPLKNFMTNFHIECDELLIQNTSPSQLPFCLPFKASSNEIKNLLEKGAIEQAEQSDSEYISNIFTREKKTFKMNTFESIADLVHKDCFMTSIGLKDAYHALVAEAIVRRCSVTKMLLKISQDSHENTCAQIHRRFPVNSVNFLRTPLCMKHHRRLLL